MFTGIIEKIGRVTAYQQMPNSARLEIQMPWTDLVVGESIAVNGVCLTVLPESSANRVCFDVSPETLKCTSLCQLNIDQPVNLERALSVNQRFGGHYVTGHVDTKIMVHRFFSEGEYQILHLKGFTTEQQRYLIAKGSLTVEGVSLTINEVQHDEVLLMLIPHTLQNTTLHRLEPGLWVNIEFDYIARIVAHQLGFLSKSNIITSSMHLNEVES